MTDPDFITSLKPNQIFVFGSNLQGVHGAGAALQAVEFGAQRGIGVGLAGQTYAIPTRAFKGRSLVTLPLEVIERYVASFLTEARELTHLEFLVTPIGTGFAGYSIGEIAPMFADSPPNVILPKEFQE